MVAQSAGFLKVGDVSLDGTKIKANASKHKALSYEYTNRLQKQLEAEVQTLMQKAQEADNEESNDGMNIPEELSRREGHLKVIKEAKALYLIASLLISYEVIYAHLLKVNLKLSFYTIL